MCGVYIKSNDGRELKTLSIDSASTCFILLFMINIIMIYKYVYIYSKYGNIKKKKKNEKLNFKLNLKI